MTNQSTTLTNQDVMLDLYKIHAYIPNDAAGNPLTPFGNFCEGYESATKASEKRITELQELLNDRQSDLDFEFNRAEQNELECNALKERVAELQIMYRGAKRLLKFNTEKNPLLIEIAELTASNNQLRVALQKSLIALEKANSTGLIKDTIWIGNAETLFDFMGEALSSTPTQSLAEHDNEVIERCAKLVINFDNYHVAPLSAEILCDAIRALKVTP